MVCIVLATALVTSGCLRALGPRVGLDLGYAVDPSRLGDPAYTTILERDASVVTAENHLKWSLVHPGPATYDFSAAETIIDWAADHDRTVRGHVLVWHQQLPAWLTNGTWTRDELIEIMRDHIHTVVGHFRDRNPGVIRQWDVVNEAFYADGSRRDTIWQQIIGDDYIELAFRFAHEADPEAELFYNDFYDNPIVVLDAIINGNPLGPGATPTQSDCALIPKCAATESLLTGLVDDDVPVHGMGFQGHLFTTDAPDYAELASWTDDLGLAWAVTELDVALPAGGDDAAGLAAQASAYTSVVDDCRRSDNCDTVVVWGVSDADSWIPGTTGGVLDHGTLYDDDLQPKPAYAALVGSLLEP